MQSKKHSLIEICVGTVIGYACAVITQIIVFPIFDIHKSPSENTMIAAVFTIISLIRGYGVRRLFNYFHVHGVFERISDWLSAFKK